jgi:hypothetical protein
METPFESSGIASPQPVATVKVASARQHRATRPQLLTRDQLDGRTNAAKLFDRLVSEIESDLGGHAALSTIQRQLVEAFVGATITLHNLNAQLALGQPIDLAEHAQAISAMVRVASRLGLQRRARGFGPTTNRGGRGMSARGPRIGMVGSQESRSTVLWRSSAPPTLTPISSHTDQNLFAGLPTWVPEILRLVI